MQKEPLLTNEHKEEKMKFANWIRTKFRKENMMNILFSDEKIFDIHGVDNSHNDRIWAANRAAADAKGSIRRKRKFPQKVMVWLGVCSKDVSPLLISRVTRSIMIGTLRKCFQPPSNMAMTCLETMGPFSKTVRSLTSMKNHRNSVPRICLRSLTRTIGLQIVLI